MSNVELRAVTKSFTSGSQGPTTVLHGVDIHARSGEFVVLLGPSGCGKSTSLRIIAGLEAADTGDVIVGGRRVNDVPAAQRHIAMVFQSYALYPHLSVLENIIFGLRVRKVKKAERLERGREAAAKLGLTDHLDRRPGQLSGGQRQRAALGRALVSDAEVVLMDEPLSNLDAKLRQQMRIELRALQRELGLTVIYVTHDQVEAMTMADRVVVMHEGRVEQVATPVELYHEPATASVAAFIGSPSMNLLRATVTAGGVELVGTRSAAHLSVALPADAPADVLVGVRPEKVTLEPDGGLRLDGVVAAVELLGADSLVNVDIGTDTPIVARVPGIATVREGGAVTVHAATSDLRLFAAASGERVPIVHAAPAGNGRA